ncbi:hypothetical protein BHE74_00014365 [Ensete ventricosum]|uniref:Uncharacterized protein n=2 Tax=Ensete ventricosum TaxID=4639 RepID=A0A444FEQ5_ENSVE|nr:hypothetical protein GW17_00014759 [Ensete ventricosum]RWW77474.1 hypothetical protein BHE74_00014365 [Ensete ventricosum]RZR73337.1 hypothetical protein BHM03_00022856 [Ensete ventricosum]
MGGKGQRRREKNYRAAHGGNTRLPPPPSVNEMEAIPSKLRKIMELKNLNSSSAKPGGHSIPFPLPQTSPMFLGPAPTPKGVGKEKRKEGSAVEKGMMDKDIDDKDATTTPSLGNERKRKRKKNAPKDLRFQELDQAAATTRKRKRKEYLEAKRKKNKKAKTDGVVDFPGREEIKFGEVVEAPPKLSVPKVIFWS